MNVPSVAFVSNSELRGLFRQWENGGQRAPFMREAGIVHMRAAQSISSHRASLTSLVRAAVRSRDQAQPPRRHCTIASCDRKDIT